MQAVIHLMQADTPDAAIDNNRIQSVECVFSRCSFALMSLPKSTDLPSLMLDIFMIKFLLQ
jgi:hypothetical protein